METLRLANYDQDVLIPLLGGMIEIRSGFDFATPGQGGVFTYEPYGAQFDFGNFQPQTETFEIAIKGNTGAVLAEVDKLQDFLESIRLYSDGDLAQQSCWLEWRARGEEAKRSLLYSGTFKVVSIDNITPGLSECTALGSLSLTRHPLWETVESSTISISAKSSIGGQQNYTNVPGNTLARIAQIYYEPAGVFALYRYWFGIRRINQGVTNFEPLWECEDGTNNFPATATTDVADGTASGGTRVQTTFATDPALVERFNISVADVWPAGPPQPEYDDAQGRYLVLMRCKVVGAGGVAGIQMRSGYTANIISEEVYIDNTDWRLIPLGNISIPPWKGDHYSGHTFAENFTINIYAEELNTCDLYMDCLVLIPNEHMLYSEGGQLCYARVDEDDTEVVYAVDTSYKIIDSVAGVFTEWYLPPGDGMIVMAAETQTAHALGDTINATIDYLPRWLLYRGV